METDRGPQKDTITKTHTLIWIFGDMEDMGDGGRLWLVVGGLIRGSMDPGRGHRGMSVLSLRADRADREDMRCRLYQGQINLLRRTKLCCWALYDPKY